VTNYAIVNLFGMNYDDSTLKDLGDIGLQGELSDSGTLRNILFDKDKPKDKPKDKRKDKPIEISQLTLCRGLREILGIETATFETKYHQEIMRLLGVLAGKNVPSKTSLLATVKRLQGLQQDKAIAVIEKACWLLGGTAKAPTACQTAFYELGVAGYSMELAQAFETALGPPLSR
jgi:hypothetical protein